MKFKTPETTNTTKPTAENKNQDFIPDYVQSEEAVAARNRLLNLAKEASEVKEKPASQPEALQTLDEHKLETLSGTSMSTRIDDRELQARAASNLGEEWVRQDLPSHSVPYLGEEIFLRPFTITVLSRVHAAMRSESFTLLVDALDHCINIDIRRLTPSDWNAMLYWLRLNSYVRTPYTIPWISKYGNQNEHRITESNLEFIELDMTLDEYKVWKEKGLCFPTVRDMELMQANDLPEEDRWRIEYSQYVDIPNIKNEDGSIDYHNYVNRKLDALEKGGLPMIEDIKDFVQRIEHGIVETVELTDTKFEPVAAVTYLRDSVKATRQMLESILNSSEDKQIEVGMIGMSQRADELEAEADLIEKTIAEGKQYIPGKETIGLSINSMHFFP